MTLALFRRVGGEGGGGGVVRARFTGIKTDLSRITQNSAFDFICRPYSFDKLLF